MNTKIIDWIHVKELSELLMVSDKTIYKWVGEKRLPMPVQIGKMRWLRSDIQKWVEDQTSSS